MDTKLTSVERRLPPGLLSGTKSLLTEQIHKHVDVHKCALTDLLKGKGRWGSGSHKEWSGGAHRTPRGGCRNSWPGSEYTWSVVPGCRHCPSWHGGHRTDLCSRPWAAQRVAERVREAAQPQIIFLKLPLSTHMPARKGRRPRTPFPFLHSRKQVSGYIAVPSAPATPPYPSGHGVASARYRSREGRGGREEPI